jgi:hypothetical protein
MIYGTLVNNQPDKSPTPPPRWYVRLRRWIKSMVKRKRCETAWSQVSHRQLRVV